MSPSGIVSPTATAAPQRTPLHARAIETVALVASVAGVRLVGVLLLSASSWSASSPTAALGMVSAIFDATLLVWVGLVAAVQFGMRRAPRSRRWMLVALAAPVAALLCAFFGSLPGPLAGFGSPLANPIALIDGTIFTMVVGLGVVIAAACLAPDRRAMAASAAVLLAIGTLLALVLVWQFFDVYFTLWGVPITVTEAHGDRYLVTATAAVAAFVGALALAISVRRRALTVTAWTLTMIGLVISFAAQVPQGRFIPDPPPPPAERPYTPCFGEGDPNCVGG